MASSPKPWLNYKSNWRIACYVLYRSRESKAQKCRELKEALEKTQRQLSTCEKRVTQREREISELKQQVRRLETEKRIAAENRACVLPEDPPVGKHGYGARMVRLSLLLAKAVGLRGAWRCLKILFRWLGINQKVPHFTTIRSWMQRVGVAELRAPVEAADDWVWMVDHSNQIGREKTLVVRGIRAAQLPPPGTPLKHKDVRLLLVKPGTTWKREDMAAVYTELAKQIGPPRAILCDGASELRDGAESLKKQRSDVIVRNDFKHKAANFFKAMLDKDQRFAEFTAQLGRTRCAIQQTELGHLVPRSLKQKARFMNLEAAWGQTRFTCFLPVRLIGACADGPSSTYSFPGASYHVMSRGNGRQKIMAPCVGSDPFYGHGSCVGSDPVSGFQDDQTGQMGGDAVAEKRIDFGYNALGDSRRLRATRIPTAGPRTKWPPAALRTIRSPGSPAWHTLRAAPICLRPTHGRTTVSHHPDLAVDRPALPLIPVWRPLRRRPPQADLGVLRI